MSKRKKAVWFFSFLVVLIVLVSFLIFTPGAETYSANVTIEVIKVEMLEDVTVEGQVIKGAFSIALNTPSVDRTPNTEM